MAIKLEHITDGFTYFTHLSYIRILLFCICFNSTWTKYYTKHTKPQITAAHSSRGDNTTLHYKSTHELHISYTQCLTINTIAAGTPPYSSVPYTSRKSNTLHHCISHTTTTQQHSPKYHTSKYTQHSKGTYTHSTIHRTNAKASKDSITYLSTTIQLLHITPFRGTITPPHHISLVLSQTTSATSGNSKPKMLKS